MKPNITDNHDGTFDVSYVPTVEGRAQIDVKYGGKQIPNRLVFTRQHVSVDIFVISNYT